MTVEECVIMIQNGDESLMPQLWDRVRGIYYKKARTYYIRNKARCDQCGVTSEDILQQSFFAFLRSIESYEPVCELPFASYIHYPFMTEMQALTYTRTSKQRADTLNQCESLDREIETPDGTAGALVDLIADPDALYFLEQVDAESVAEIVRAEVRALRSPLCEVITLYYFSGKTFQQIGETLGISWQRVQQLKRDALFELKKRRVLVELWNESKRTEKARQRERLERGYNPVNYLDLMIAKFPEMAAYFA